MKRAMSVFVVAATIIAASVAVAQEGEAPQISAEQQAAMDAWMKAATPGPEQERLAQLEGHWKVTSKAWMAPGAEPEVSVGTSTSKMILGGRYLHERVGSQMMGMPFEGIGTTGYDNVKKTYVSSWVDTFGTGILYSEGTWDEGRNSLTLHAEFLDPMSGKMTKMRMVTRIVDADTHVAEFYQPGPDGQEFKGMELTYTRTTAPATSETKETKDQGKR